MVHKMFDKVTSAIGIKTMPDQCLLDLATKQLPNELPPPIIKNFKRTRAYSSFKDNISGVDLADMQLLSNFNEFVFYYALLIFLANMHGLFLSKIRKVRLLLMHFKVV